MIDLSIILAKRNIFIDQRPTTLLVRAEENITFERDPFSSHCFFPCQFPKCRNYFSVFQTTREQLLFRFSPQVERRVKRQAPRLLDNAYVYLKSGISRRKIVSGYVCCGLSSRPRRVYKLASGGLRIVKASLPGNSWSRSHCHISLLLHERINKQPMTT